MRETTERASFYLRSISRDLTYAAIDIGSNAVRLLIELFRSLIFT